MARIPLATRLGAPSAPTRPGYGRPAMMAGMQSTAVPVPARTEQPARGGFHLLEWGCEAAGTALLLLGGLSAVILDFGPHSVLRGLGTSPRLLITGLLFAGAGSLVAISPLGRRSGAHLNPVVTLAFWTQGKVHLHDLVGYIVSQLAGAVAGTALIALLWGAEGRAVHLGATVPGRGVTDGRATLIEAGMTALLVLAILLLTSNVATTRWTPLALWLLIAVMVWQGASYTGTSLNPARSLGPALLAPKLADYWVYVVGPLSGGAVAVGAFALLRHRRVLTTKLFHDPRYPSTMGSSLPAGAPRTAKSARSARN